MNNAKLIQNLMIQVKQNNTLESGIVIHIKNMDTLCVGLEALISKDDVNRYEGLNEIVRYETTITAYVMLIKASIHTLKLLLSEESNIITGEKTNK